MNHRPNCHLWEPQPALLLEEVKKDNLPHELLGEVGGADLLGSEFRADGSVLPHEVVKVVYEVKKQHLVLLEELLCDRLDAEDILKFRQ